MRPYQQRKSTVLQEMERWLELMDAAVDREPPLDPIPPDENDRQRIRQALRDADAATRTRKLISIVRNLDLRYDYGQWDLRAYLEGEDAAYEAPLTLDELHERGELVFEHRSSEGAALVYRLDDHFHYARSSRFEVSCGFPELDDLLEYDDYQVGPETERVWCSLLSREELIDRLEYDQGAEPVPLEVNGEPWTPPPTKRAIEGNGEVVFTLLEEDATGLWGMYVYRYGSEYYTYDMAEDCIRDRYESLRDALLTEEDRFLTVTPVTVSVESPEISFEDLSSLLVVVDPAFGSVEPESITVNGKRWPPASADGE